MSNKKILIIQTSPKGTASTVLTNLLYGFICPDRNVEYVEFNQKKIHDFKQNINIVKTHSMNIHKIRRFYEKNYDVYFVCSERNERKLFINKEYIKYPNVCVFDYNDLSETPNQTLESIVDTVHDKLHEFLPRSITLCKETAIGRIINMNTLYESIKDKSFEYYDTFYHLHGSHRNRNYA